MFKTLQVTLYDIFGYLLPGTVALVAVVVVMWAVLMPAKPLKLPLTDIALANWFAAMVVAYLIGHLVQALANQLGMLLRSTEDLMLSPDREGGMSVALVAAAWARAGSIVRLYDAAMDPDLLHRICDEVVVQRGNASDRDLYIYREGFYRGMTIAFGLLFLSLVVRTAIPGTALKLSGTVCCVPWLLLLSVAAAMLAGAWLCFRRYRRFGRYRVEQALVGFMVLLDRPGQAKSE